MVFTASICVCSRTVRGVVGNGVRHWTETEWYPGCCVALRCVRPMGSAHRHHPAADGGVVCLPPHPQAALVSTVNTQINANPVIEATPQLNFHTPRLH